MARLCYFIGRPIRCLIDGGSMATPSSQEITQLLIAWSHGDQAALEKLTPLVHDELRRLAQRYMARERHGHTLQTTALVNEAYLRLIDQESRQWQNRAHFFGVAAQMMRHILMDYARTQHRMKRGGEAIQVSLAEAAGISQGRASDLLALDDALTALATLNARHSQVVELRFFGGLSLEEIAEVLKVSVGTVRRDWSLAKAWLYDELSNKGGGE